MVDIASFGLQTFAGSATFANSNIASGGASINSIDFSSAGSTITMTQSSGISVMSGNQVQVQYQGTNIRNNNARSNSAKFRLLSSKWGKWNTNNNKCL